MSELSLHISVVTALRQLAKPGVWFWHCPNGEHRDKRTAAKLKAMGVMPGISDLIISMSPEAPGIPGRMGFLELKWDRGKLTDEQRDFLEAMAARGHMTGVAYSLDVALGLLSQWGAIRPLTVQSAHAA